MAVLATDNFNRADANPISGSWAVSSDSNLWLRILSNQVRFSIAGGGNDGWAAYTGITWPDDQWSQAACIAGSAGGGAGPGVMCRQATNASTVTRYRLITSTAASNNFQLLKQVAGVSTTLWSRTSSFSSGNLIRIDAQGTTLRGFNNNVKIGADLIDSAITSGNPGLFYSSTDASALMDDWQGGDFEPTTTTIRKTKLRPAPFKPGKPFGKVIS